MHTKGTNRELAHEARTTENTSRQAVLAEHNSDLVLRALSTNPKLDPSLIEAVKNKLNLFRIVIHNAAVVAANTDTDHKNEPSD